jgi:hypothetical protein
MINLPCLVESKEIIPFAIAATDMRQDRKVIHGNR